MEEDCEQNRSKTEIDNLYVEFITLSRPPSKPIADYTVRVQQAAEELIGTKYEQKEEDVVTKWRQGLGDGFARINELFDMTNLVPKGWEEKKCLFPLIGVAKAHLKKYKLPE
eukprot:2711444-Ditylum_brightwellii.AAC.1